MNAIADVRYLNQPQFDQLEPRFDSEYGVYWAQLNLRPHPSFNPQLLIEVRQFIDGIISGQGKITKGGR